MYPIARNGRSSKPDEVVRINFFFFFFFFCFFFLLFKAALAAYRSSWARGQTGAEAGGHSHSHTRSQPHLQPIPQLTQCQILNTLSVARDRTHSLMDTSWVH